jgi:hypothetical protein
MITILYLFYKEKKNNRFSGYLLLILMTRRKEIRAINNSCTQQMQIGTKRNISSATKNKILDKYQHVLPFIFMIINVIRLVIIPFSLNAF